jgi:hypothetical protein
MKKYLLMLALMLVTAFSYAQNEPFNRTKSQIKAEYKTWTFEQEETNGQSVIVTYSRKTGTDTITKIFLFENDLCKSILISFPLAYLDALIANYNFDKNYLKEDEDSLKWVNIKEKIVVSIKLSEGKDRVQVLKQISN